MCKKKQADGKRNYAVIVKRMRIVSRDMFKFLCMFNFCEIRSELVETRYGVADFTSLSRSASNSYEKLSVQLDDLGIASHLIFAVPYLASRFDK